MSFSVEVNGDPTQVEFAIEARALPFMSISSDVRIYEKLEDIFGKLDDETEQFDEDEMGEMGDEHSAEPDGEQTETAGESAEAKEDDDDSTAELPPSQDSTSSRS